MTLFATIAFTAFVLKNKNFSMFGLFNDMTFDKGPLENRLAHFHILTIGHHENLIKGNISANLTGQLLDLQDIACFNFLLFATSGYNGIHRCFLQKNDPQTIKKPDN